MSNRIGKKTFLAYMVKSLKITQVLCKESQMVCSLKKNRYLHLEKDESVILIME